jgi:hypothetical protein
VGCRLWFPSGSLDYERLMILMHKWGFNDGNLDIRIYTSEPLWQYITSRLQKAFIFIKNLGDDYS